MKSLLYGDRVWQPLEEDGDLVDRARSDLGCSRTFARILTNRYGDNYARVTEDPEKGLHAPGNLPDISPAVNRIIAALEGQEDVFIHGDFDVDGLSSAAILYRGLKDFGRFPGPGRLKVCVGDRDRGHGLNRSVSARLIDEGFDLLITTDCGVKGTKEIAHLSNHGVDVIVTDHHAPPEVLPPAVGVVDPKVPSSTYPNTYLAGAGVAFKVMEELYEQVGVEGQTGRGELLQLAALGTIADMVPLLVDGEDENRLLAKLGIEEMDDDPIPGISVLLSEVNGGERKREPVSPQHISYRIAPKLNSANRVGDPKVGFLLLATDNYEKAGHLARTLIDYDRDRSRVQRKLTREAEEQLQVGGFSPDREGVIFVIGHEWNPGVIGLVSSRLSNKYDMPAITISEGGRRSRGSARSVSGLSIVEGFNSCADHLEKYGGHSMAGGFTVPTEEIDDLQACLNDWALSEMENRHVKQLDYVEGELSPGQASMSLAEELDALQPFGEGNPEPRFFMRGLNAVSVRRVGKSNKHLKIKLAGKDEIFDGIGFGLGESISEVNFSNPVNPVFTLEVNVWNGERNVQLNLKDFVTEG
ncbi:MAG: single-stranded-DNA-specific exonuclease RecJ [Candidatus Acetothermia bacterium]